MSEKKEESPFLRAYTDYPFGKLGDAPGQKAPMREVLVISYDGDRCCRVLVEGDVLEVKAGYLYAEKCGVPISTAELQNLPPGLEVPDPAERTVDDVEELMREARAAKEQHRNIERVILEEIERWEDCLPRISAWSEGTIVLPGGAKFNLGFGRLQDGYRLLVSPILEKASISLLAGQPFDITSAAISQMPEFARGMIKEVKRIAECMGDES